MPFSCQFLLPLYGSELRRLRSIGPKFRWGINLRESMKKPVLRLSTLVVAIVLALTAAPGLRRAAGNQAPQHQAAARATNTAIVGGMPVLRSNWMNERASSLAVPLVAPTQKYSSGSVPPATVMSQFVQGPTLRAIMLKISGEPQLLLLFGSVLISLAFLLRSWSTSS